MSIINDKNNNSKFSVNNSKDVIDSDLNNNNKLVNLNSVDFDYSVYHIPRWKELPNIDLYIDQVVSFLQLNLSSYIISNGNNSSNFITKTMINNYVKHKVLKAPIAKKYNREHLAYLFVIFILKQIYSMEEITKFIDLAIKASPIEISYNKFCDELELAIYSTFTNSCNSSDSLPSIQYLLRSVVFSISNKLYVQKTFLNK